MTDDQAVRERLAALCHEQWSGWMRWMFGKMEVQGGVLITLDKFWYDRWMRQVQTPYAALSEAEKDSDRKEADRILAALAAVRGTK